jgi:fumarate reductase flavoprotein subunit
MMRPMGTPGLRGSDDIFWHILDWSRVTRLLRADRATNDERWNTMGSDRDVDVLVMGSGAAGLSAALAARESGADSVLVAEAEGIVGGSSRLSGGLTMGAGTRYQKALGIEDDADSLFHDYMQLNQWKVEQPSSGGCASGPGRRWSGWATSAWSTTTSWCTAATRVPRSTAPSGGAGRRRCWPATAATRVDVALGRRVDRLLRTTARWASRSGTTPSPPVRWWSRPAASATARRSWRSPRPQRRSGPGTSAPRLARRPPRPGRAGRRRSRATTVGLRLLHANFATIYEAYLPGWLVLVNREGRRFCDETAPYGIMDGLIQEQGAIAFAIFDQVALDEATAAGVARYKQQVPGSTKKQSPHWNADVVEAMVRSGRVQRAADPGARHPLTLPLTTSRRRSTG